MSILKLYKNKDYTLVPRPQYSPTIPDLVQVGWIGQSGEVYALDDEPKDGREKGSWQPLLIVVGRWVYDENSEDYRLDED